MSVDANSMVKDITQVIGTANQALEYIWSTIASTAKEIGSTTITNCASLRALSYNPQNRKALEAQPRAIAGTQKICELIQKILAEIQKNSNIYQNWALIGKCYLMIDDFTNAYSSFAHVLRLLKAENFSDIYFWYAIACVHQHFGYNNDSLRFYQHALDLAKGAKMNERNSPFLYDLHFRLGLLYRAMGNYAAAINELDIAKASPPLGLTVDDLTFQIAFTSLMIPGQSQENGIRELRVLTQKYPKSLGCMQQFLWSLSFRNDEKLLREGKQIIDSHPEFNDDSLIQFAAARIAYKGKDIESSFLKYRQCINDWADSPVLWCDLGVLYFKNNQKQEALMAFQRALYQKPEIPEAWLNIGMVFETSDNLPSALKIYEAGRQNCPKSQKLIDRYNRLSTGQKMPQRVEIEEISNSEHFTQIGDIHAHSIISSPPLIPGMVFSNDESIARAIDDLHVPYESLFVD